jgi:hypothetical protein
MKALFGVVSLLVALAIVGLVVVKQMKATRLVAAPAADAAGLPAAPMMSGSGALREQSQQLQSKVAQDVAKALEQGAAARRDAIGK